MAASRVGTNISDGSDASAGPNDEHHRLSPDVPIDAAVPPTN